MVHKGNNDDPSLPIFEWVKNNLPEQDGNENTKPINGREFFLWMIGIAGALFLLRYVFLLLF